MYATLTLDAVPVPTALPYRARSPLSTECLAEKGCRDEARDKDRRAYDWREVQQFYLRRAAYIF